MPMVWNEFRGKHIWEPVPLPMSDENHWTYWSRERRTMESVTVDKKDLIAAIQKNRDEHRAIFEEAIEGYRKRAIEVLDDQIAKLKDGKKERVHVSLPYPTDHTSDYDRVLKMLGMHTEETIEIPENYFRQYVLDDWNWQTEFLTTSSNYSALARGKFGS